MYVCVFVYMCVYICTYVYMCVHVCIYIYIYMYTYTGKHVPLPKGHTKCTRPGCDDGKRYNNQGRPYKIFNYFSPITQLCNRVWWKNFTAQLQPLRDPHSPDIPEDEAVNHVHDADICKKWRDFLWTKEIMQLANGVILFLCLSSDGYNPFNSGVYSTAFIALRIMSYRHGFGYKLEHIIHVGIVPGPSKPFSLQPYLDILVDDLILLSMGVRCPNPLNPTEVKILFAYLLLVAADYPGHAEIHGLEGSSSHNGCYKCCVATYTVKGSKQICACRFRDLLDEGDDIAMGARTRTTRMPPPIRKTKDRVAEWTAEVEKTGITLNGIKEKCALSRLKYYNWVASICFDFAHCGKNVWHHIRASFCSQLANTVPQEPKQPDMSGKTEAEKTKATKLYKANVKNWKARCTARLEILEDTKHIALSAEDLRGCDVRYRWAASPGLADHDKTIMLRKGDLNFHQSVDLITTKLLLYCLYPYCDPEFYIALVGLIEIWTVLLDVDIPKKELAEYVPKLNKRMAVWETIAPFTCLGYMFHAAKHILEMRVDAGCLQQYWMYFFERFVAYLRRLCKSRVHPEANMSTEFGLHMYLDEVTYSRCDLGELLKDSKQPLAQEMLSSLKLDVEDVNSVKAQAVYSLPKRLREYRSRLLCQSEIQKLRDTNKLSKEFLKSTENLRCEVYRYKANTVCVHGLARSTINREPALGSSVHCVRKSGFRYIGTEIEHKNDLVGSVCQFLVVNGSELFVLVNLYRLLVHTVSTLERVTVVNDINLHLNTKAVIPAVSLGKYVVFAPWTDRTKKIDKDYLCVLYKSGASTYDT